MSFQCSDLDDALRFEELPSDAKDHAKTCAHCQQRLEMWSAIRDTAPELHREWESPALWPRIQSELQGPSKHRGAILRWQYALAAAAAVLLVIALYLPWSAVDSTEVAHDSPFLNAESLREVERAENAYVRAIEKLSAAAGTTLEESPTPLAALYREKLALLDSAIADLKAGVDANGYNVYLQTQLASLYREKQRTLEEWIENAKNN